ncbi:DUF3581 domain-containing protein [Psychromonas ossibalaenae]|uniref:DUF3581 domain-containing protein n=1 Tax=Psychromonas ossibalaenae TaxID=444922 RepID=UPI0003639C4C|nr:DUF3581 domain-containing protein [Psychromonas ossibalaenae]
MLLESYYTKQNNLVRISAAQASTFAKQECRDFNPIHDPENKRFCVPGDLLFSLALNEYGVSESMSFTFTNMVGDNIGLVFPEADGEHIVITNEQGKSVLEINKKGKTSHDPALIESLIQNYVVFSGQNFPTLLMPLMKKHNVMFNPARPLVMYNSMSFEFDELALEAPVNVELADSLFEVEPKRANNFLHFAINDGEKSIGRGIKKMVVAGLKPYDHESITAFSDAYEARRSAF